jgi:hypothetical protein
VWGSPEQTHRSFHKSNSALAAARAIEAQPKGLEPRPRLLAYRAASAHSRYNAVASPALFHYETLTGRDRMPRNGSFVSTIACASICILGNGGCLRLHHLLVGCNWCGCARVHLAARRSSDRRFVRMLKNAELDQVFRAHRSPNAGSTRRSRPATSMRAGRPNPTVDLT